MQHPHRTEYRQLLADFSMHARSFGLAPTSDDLASITALLVAMDRVDLAVDSLHRAGDRAGLCERVLSRLRGSEVEVSGLESCLDGLRERLERRDVVEAFVELTAEAFDVAERLRGVTDRDDYFLAVLQEGLLTPRMTLCVVGSQSPEFDRFLLSLGRAGNFVDELRDVRDDVRRGEKRIRPGVRLHLGLARHLLSGTLSALPLHPRPLSVLIWGGKHLLGRYPQG